MKTVIVPDVHNKVKKVERILLKEVPDRVIFLGDWFDDFGDTVEDNQATARWLVNRMDKHPEDIFLWGNHDTHYANPCRETVCSGFTKDKHIGITDMMSLKHWDRFDFIFWEGQWLFSHAGVTAPHFSGAPKDDLKGWLENQQMQAQMRLRSSKPHWFFQAGMARGGRAPFGGVNWCDITEFIPTDNVSQVFGHTPRREPWKYDTNRRNKVTVNSENYGIDTHLEYYGVLVDGKFTPVRLDPPHETVRKD
jgi:hypothetical protein